MKLPKNSKLFVTIFLCIVWSMSVSARTYYVSSSYAGSTSNGDLTTPWKNLSSVQNNFSIIQPGDSIAFKKGDIFYGTLSILKSGLQNFPIVFTSYGSGNKPQFAGTGSKISSLFYLYNKSFIVFNDLDIMDNSISATDRSIPSKIQIGYYFDGISTNNIVKNCKISLVGVGLYLSSNCNRNNIDSCDIGNMRMIVNTPTSVNPDDDYGANPIVISSSYNTVKHSYFHDCWALSYDYGYDGGAVEFYGGTGVDSNLIAYNTFYDCNGTVEMGSSSGGYMNNNSFVYNKFINNGKLFYINNSGQYAVNIQNLFFGNNIIIESTVNRLNETNLGSMSASSTLSNIINFKNNVFQLSTGIDVIKPNLFTSGQFNHQNNIYKLSNGSITNFNLSVNELLNNSSFWVNTLSSNPLLWDYHPLANSILIDFGQNINQQKDFEGKSIIGMPEAGILEQNADILSVPLNIVIRFTPILCNGDSSIITVSALGGIPPYTGVGIFKKVAGTYNFIVTDAIGNNTSAGISITQPTIIDLNINAGTIFNYGGTTTVNLSANGGMGPYLYSIDNLNFQNSNQFNNIGSGNHNAYTKDQNNCLVSKNFYIPPPVIEPLTVSILASKINCYGEYSVVTITALGGISPYTGTGNFSYPSGTYTFTITDSIGSAVSKTITIPQPLPITIISPSTNILTNTNYTSIQISVSGGTPQYQYKLDNGNYQSNNVFDSAIVGLHTLTVKDANNCQQTQEFNISKTQTEPLQVIIENKANVSCKGNNDGSIKVTGIGGSSPYLYALDTNYFTVNNQFVNLRAGSYNIYIKDQNNQIANTTTTIADGLKKCKGIRNTAGTNHHKIEVIVYPNPSNNFFNFEVISESDEEFIITIMDIYGRLISKERKYLGKINEIGSTLQKGSYFLRIQQGNESTTQKLIKL